MAAARSRAVAMELDGLEPMLRAFNTYGKEANRELREASKKIADETVQQARSASSGVGGPAGLAGSSLRATSDRVPSLAFGGAKRVGHRGTPVGQLIFGAEFGGRGRPTTQQFLPHRGRAGYFLFPTMRERGQTDTHIYLEALDRLGAKWAGV